MAYQIIGWNTSCLAHQGSLKPSSGRIAKTLEPFPESDPFRGPEGRKDRNAERAELQGRRARANQSEGVARRIERSGARQGRVGWLSTARAQRAENALVQK